jgi:UMF1 family MFS transporter
VAPSGGATTLDHTWDPQTLWGYVVGGSGVVLVALAPILGAIADVSGTKRGFLSTALGSAIAATLLGCVGADRVTATVLLFATAQAGLVGGLVFYDASLPEIASMDALDRVSERGFAYGYVGGGLQFAATLAVVAGHETIGLTREQAVRLAIATAGLWWLGFGAVSALRLGRQT